jgi:predicted transcriptional regulator
VGHLLVKKPVTIPGEATILEAAKLMVSRNIGVLVLVNPNKPDTPLTACRSRNTCSKWLQKDLSPFS